MTDARAASGWRERSRWAACFVLALGLHLGGALAVLARWTDQPDQIATAPVITIDLSPVAAAPESHHFDLPPGPPSIDSQAPAEEKPETTETVTREVAPEPPPSPLPQLAAAPDPVVALPQPEQPKRVEPPIPPEPEAQPKQVERAKPKPAEKKPIREKPVRERQAMLSAPSAAEQRAARAEAPMLGPVTRQASNSLPSWKSLLAAQLERNKRYPSDANGEQGVAQLAFSIDRQGRAHNVRIVRSSGSAALDQETLALVRRASPFPPPPADVSGGQIAVMVPIRYTAR